MAGGRGGVIRLMREWGGDDVPGDDAAGGLPMSSLLETATMPIVTCAGEPRRRGRSHGEELRDKIAAGTGRWLEALRSRHGIDPDEYLREFLDNTDHLPAIRRWTPDLLEEVRGIAEGAGQPFPRILAYNLMDEDWSY